MVRTRGVTAKDGTVTQIDTDAVRVIGTHGASCQIPCGGVEAVAPVDALARPLNTRATRHFAAFRAGEDQLLIATADDLILREDVRQPFLSGVTVADRFDDVRVCVRFEDITHVSSGTMAA